VLINFNALNIPKGNLLNSVNDKGKGIDEKPKTFDKYFKVPGVLEEPCGQIRVRLAISKEFIEAWWKIGPKETAKRVRLHLQPANKVN